MIDQIELKVGRPADDSPLSFTATPVTIFVGPNNSGKSLALREINSICHRYKSTEGRSIIKSITFLPMSREQITSEFERLYKTRRNNNRQEKDSVFVGSNEGSHEVKKDVLEKALAEPNFNNDSFTKYFLAHTTLSLHGTNRMQLCEDREGKLLRDATNALEKLFQNDSLREKVRSIVFDAFKSYFVVDPTDLGKLKIRLSSAPPSSPIQERGLHSEAIEFHRQALPISQTSDGVRAFVGIVMEIIAGDPIVVVIDEPEAFLHPSLAFKLGLEAASAARTENKRLLVATHSAQFLMGCIQSGVPINIIRLTYHEKIGTARLLNSDLLLRLMRNPLLRSSGVLAALFYEFVIITEGDSDRAFYQEINERLLLENKGRG